MDERVALGVEGDGADGRAVASAPRPASGLALARAVVPVVTKSMRIAIDDLRLDALYIVCPGEHRYALGDGITAVPVWAMLPTGTCIA